MQNIGVSLTGGGARGSYQSGVLLGLSEILSENGLGGKQNILKTWSGVSAGSINACFMAGGIKDIHKASLELSEFWSKIEPHYVYKTDFTSLTANGIKWARDLTFGSVFEKKLAHSLLDTAPLWDYLKKIINLNNLSNNVRDGLVDGVACSAYSYTNNRTVSFLETNENVEWNRQRRSSLKTHINLSHVMASCAIPLLFPSVKIGDEYFADGGFRNLSPISPMVHMNVKKMLVIGVRGSDEFSEKRYKFKPTVAKIAGAMLNALFFDTIDIDLERLRHINEFLEATISTVETRRSSYSKISYLTIRPSRDISRIAEENEKHFPRLIKFLMGGLGPIKESSELASYLLFLPKFTKVLVELGYQDALSRKNELLQWIESE